MKRLNMSSTDGWVNKVGLFRVMNSTVSVGPYEMALDQNRVSVAPCFRRNTTSFKRIQAALKNDNEIPLDLTYGDLPEALVQHGHQQLGEDNDHHNVVGADDEGAHERAQLLRVVDARDEQCHMSQGEDVPEQGIAGPHKPGVKGQ